MFARSSRLLALVCLLSSLPAAQGPDQVLDHQKISRSAGGLGNGVLEDGDEFGGAVAALGDVNGDGIADLAVAASGDDDAGPDYGAVWLLLLNADGTVESEQKISDATGGFGGALDHGDLFGSSLVSLGDLNGDGLEELAVGASGDDDGDRDCGAVWILSLHPGGSVASEQKISAAAGGFGGSLDLGDAFGCAVAALGDLDGDGVEDLAVGAYGDDDGALTTGAIWVLFLNADGTVASEQKISALAGGFGGAITGGDAFGSSLHALGDLEGDGVVDLVVGAPGDDDGGTDCGAAWILFLNSDGTVKSEQLISATAGGFGGTLDSYDYFGSSLAGLDDLDGDGIEDLAVGVPFDDDGGTSAGAIWILFLRANGTVRSKQKISVLAGGFGGAVGYGDHFGCSLARLGDLDGDGIADLAVGAIGDDDGSGTWGDPGAAWIVFLHPDGTVDSEQKISALQGGFGHSLEEGDSFGASSAYLGDCDGDGLHELVVGTPARDDGGPGRGAAVILRLVPGGTVVEEYWLRDGTRGLLGPLGDGDAFGASCAHIVDLGFGDLHALAVGAPGDDDGGSDRGAVWILLSEGGRDLLGAKKISAATGGFAGILDDGDAFGFAAAGIGDVDGDGAMDLAVGAPGDDDGGADRGAVWILFFDPSGALLGETKISDTTGGFAGGLADGDAFGSAIAKVGDLDGDGIADLAVGAPGDDGAGVDRGAVWLLLLDGAGGVRAQTRIVPPGLDDGDGFGASLAGGHDLDGDGLLDLAVGAPGADGAGDDRGAVWILLVRAGGGGIDHVRISDEHGGFDGVLADGDRFADSLAMLGDLDGDGLADLVVGAPGTDDGGADCGALWILFCNTITPANATVSWRNGGANPDVFRSTSLPVVGASWTSEVDGGSAGATGLVLVTGYSDDLSGLDTPYGQLLIDVTSEWTFGDWGRLGASGTSHHEVPVPDEAFLIGVHVYTQALLNNLNGAPRLTNAWDLVLGF